MKRSAYLNSAAAGVLFGIVASAASAAQFDIPAGTLEGALTAYPVEQDSIDLGGWWRRPRTTLLLHREYFKYLASLLTTRLAAA